ncbi:MAG: single-stranded-DNA-specific exonuclease RecJ [Myxococcales bacterium]|nr:single-stranded-DNA-specific exonuclease RecJ [Polyangiaceae bacterium]MDW8250157.1 single-stranded-DNA-specific exonuclease RecJ [Myxococcales bacterium]
MQLPSPASASAQALARALHITITAADLLERRGYGDVEAARRFLDPKLSQMTRPDAMADRVIAAERIAQAIRTREPTVIFGDYDCDGITAAVILTETIRLLGGKVTPMLASRFDGGYGLSDPALARILEHRPSLLITCDCGSADAPRVLRARQAGVDVIVIDHHLVPPEPLPALAFLNPHRPECGFPYKGMASCGLAMSMAAAVRSALRVELDVRRFLDLVAIGTIADVAPLDGDNRAMVRAGLEAIRKGGRPGLRALASSARLDLARPLTSQDISFVIAPRLNAPGRLGRPEAALDLLLACNDQEAQVAARTCEEANQLRQEIQKTIVAEAEEQLRALGPRNAYVLASPAWHQGVVGIVAGRIASTLQRPVIVAAVDHQGVATGSVRTAHGIDIHQALGACRELLLGFGGHAKAAGVTFRIERLADLQAAFALACASQDAVEAPPVACDVLLDPHDDPEKVVRDLARLEPCGEGNRVPRLGLPGVQLRNVREVRGGHLRADVDFGRYTLGVFGPNLGAQLQTLTSSKVHLVGELRFDTYRGGGAVEIKAEALVDG